MDVLDRLVATANLLGNHAKEMQRIGMLRIDLQDLPIERLRLRQITRLVSL